MAATLDQVLLTLGLEDCMPFAEAVTDPEVLEACLPDDPVAAVSEALARLFHRGDVFIYQGTWYQEPSRAKGSMAEALISDQSAYVYDTEDPQEVRAYFVNVDNVVIEAK